MVTAKAAPGPGPHAQASQSLPGPSRNGGSQMAEMRAKRESLRLDIFHLLGVYDDLTLSKVQKLLETRHRPATKTDISVGRGLPPGSLICTLTSHSLGVSRVFLKKQTAKAGGPTS